MGLGNSLPRQHAAQEFDYSYGHDALRFLESVGLHLYPWQQRVLIEWLGERNGTWVHPECVLVVPRQNGKSFLLAARILVGLFMLPDERQILFSAHTLKTCREVFKIVRTTIEANPALKRRTRTIRLANGQEEINTGRLEGGKWHDITEVHFLARKNSINSSFRGFSPDTIILDEALILSDDAWSSIEPVLSARDNPQAIISSSAGTAESTVLRDFVDDGRAGAPGLSYNEWEGSGLDPGAVETWDAANPSLGFRKQLSTMEASYRKAAKHGGAKLDAWCREHLGIWSEARADTALSIDGYASVGVGSLPVPERAVISVDVHQIPGGERHAAVVLSWLVDGVPHSMLWRQEPGVKWLTQQLVNDVARFSASGVFMSVGGARDVAEDLEAAGVKVHALNVGEWKAACTGLGQAVNDDAVRVQVTPLLSSAVAAAEPRHWPEGSWTFDGTKTNGVPIPGLVAWAVGAWAAKSTAAATYDVLESVF